MTDSPDADREGSTTTSTRTRWDYTNDVLAGVLVVSVPLLTGLAARGAVDAGAVPVEIRLGWLSLATVATAWAFGPSAAAAAAKIRGN